jgi:hypothetical protein
MALIAIGFIICLASSGHSIPGVVYFGVFIAVIGETCASHIRDEPKTNQIRPGIYPAFPGNVTWLSVNLAGDYKRAAGMAIYIGLGNLAGGK